MQRIALILFVGAVVLVGHTMAASVSPSLTYDELVSFNGIELRNCGQEALEQRTDIYERARREYESVWRKEEFTQMLHSQYVKTLEYCIEHKEEVVAEGINDDKAIDQLYEKLDSLAQ